MLNLTDKETILIEYLIGTTEASQVVCYEDFFPKEILEKLNVNFQQVKGIYGSLVNKNILTFSNNINGQYDSYEWTVNVEDYGQGEINTVEKLLKEINTQSNLEENPPSDCYVLGREYTKEDIEEAKQMKLNDKKVAQ